MIRLENASTMRADDEQYRLVSIDTIRAPEGCTGHDWYIYRIAQGENGITGYRRGDLARVRTDVETIVLALNGRRDWTTKSTAKSQRAAAGARRKLPSRFLKGTVP